MKKLRAPGACTPSYNARPRGGAAASHGPSRILFPPSERGLSAPVPSIMYENWAGVDIMYHLDGRRRLQSLVYFGEPETW